MFKIALQARHKRCGGAGNFLNNLVNVFEQTSGVSIVNARNPLQHIGLFNSVSTGLPFKPYVLRMDGIYFDRMETMGANEALNRRIYRSIRNASGIVFQSEFSKMLIESHFGSIDCPSTIICNGAPINRKEKPHSNYDKVTIVCSAVWRRHKRLKETIEVVRRVNRSIPCDLIVLGEIEEELPSYEFLKLMGKVPQEVLFNYIKTADVFLHLCWLDNCPNSVVDALSHGVPVVCSNQGGTRELLEKTRGGIVVDCDEDVDCSGLVDLYHPPAPNIDKVVGAVEEVIKNQAYYSSDMDLASIDIKIVSKKYLSFLNRIAGRDQSDLLRAG